VAHARRTGGAEKGAEPEIRSGRGGARKTASEATYSARGPLNAEGERGNRREGGAKELVCVRRRAAGNKGDAARAVGNVLRREASNKEAGWPERARRPTSSWGERERIVAKDGTQLVG
jgi:hypothetical protein